MNKIVPFIKEKGLSYSLLFLMLFALKSHYSSAPVDSLSWILAPTAKVVSLVNSTPFVEQFGEGYVNLNSRVIIAKSCAGINFMIILFMMITLPVLGNLKAKRAQIGYLISALLMAYLLTILVNTIRITISMELFQLNIYNETITKALVHKIAGIGIYFSALLMIYPLIMNGIDRIILHKKHLHRSSLAPFLCYLAVTLLVPLLNRSGSLEWAFISHQLYVILVPLFLIGCIKLTRKFIRKTV